MTLLAEIKAKCTPAQLATRDPVSIAAIVSVGRTRLQTTFIGYGSVMDALGPVDGANALNALESGAASSPPIKWAMKLLDRGELDLSKPSTRGQLQALVGTIFTQAQVDILLALASTPDPITELDVRSTLWDALGTWLGG